MMWGIVFSAFEWLGFSPLEPIASVLGVNIAAVNLLFSIFMTYPLAVFYEKQVENQSEHRKHLFMIASGLDIAWFNFGISSYHSIIAVAVFIITANVFGPGKLHTITTFTFNMTYLLTAYHYTESENYDVTWTMPHCVMVLKLIGCSFDIWDGEIPVCKLSEMNKKTALREIPSTLEMFGFIYFPAAFLVGPQFSMKRYQDLISGKLLKSNATPSKDQAAYIRGCVGVLYMTMFQIGGSYFNQSTFMTEEFNNYSFVYKHIFIGLWGKFVLYKYLACWLLTEACCIRFGLAYNGEENGKTLWTGCENVKLIRFETAAKFGHYIDSFNVNTNFWVGKYLFRRLKFMGNKYLSQFFSLLFLALWHGLMSGYYMTFLMEYVIMFMEKDLEPMLENLSMYKKMWSSPIMRVLLFVFLKVYTIVFMGYCLIPFNLKSVYQWWHVYSSVYFSGFILFFPWAIVYKPILIWLIKQRIIR